MNGSDGRVEEPPEDARPSGSQSRRLAAEWVRRAGRGTTRRHPPVWQPEQEASGGMGLTGGPRNHQKTPARLAATGGG